MGMRIRPVKSIEGTIVLPPDTDAFVIAAVCALGLDTPVQVVPAPAECDYTTQWMQRFAAHMSIEEQEDESLLCAPRAQADAIWDVPFADMPLGEFTVFVLLGAGRKVQVSSLARHTITSWIDTGAACSVQLHQHEHNHESVLSLRDAAGFRAPQDTLTPDTLLRCMGLAAGLRARVDFISDAGPLTFVRSLLTSFGVSVDVSTENETPDDDPIAQRLRFLKKKSAPLQYRVRMECPRKPSNGETRPATISLPGDRLLCALFLAARAIVPRGFLAVENTLCEPQSIPTVSFVKKCGASVHYHTAHQTSFGTSGSIKMTAATLKGLKFDCMPGSYTHPFVPSMAVIASYIRKKTILKGLTAVRDYAHDPVARWATCLDNIGVHYGLMPEGIVIEGARQYDGFDEHRALPAGMAAGCVIAALRCMGGSDIDAHAILARWPGFFDMLEEVCEFKKA